MTNILPIRILIIDDDEDDFFITSSLIENIEGRNFIIDWCYNYKTGMDLICDRKYDLYFIDYRLGAKTGLDLIREANVKNCQVPMVLLTGKGTQEIDIQAMLAGAVDYLVKPDLNSEKLERCIRYSLERFSTLKALRANEKKFRNIFERSKDAVFLADERLFFLDVNIAASDLLGFTRGQLLELSLFDLMVHEENRVQIANGLLLTGNINDKEIELSTRTREKRYCILSLSKESDGSEGSYVQGIIHDITNLKKAEKATLQIEKLGVAGRLVRTLAHEVRNPLNNINLAVLQLNQEIIKEPSLLFLQIIQRNSQRIGDLIAELLNTSRPADIMLHRLSLQGILEESIVAAKDRLMLKGISLEAKFPDEPAYIMADTTKLKIAFLNIIINAIEAMEEKKGALTIELKNKMQEHVVVISDNGTGISDENLSRLFEPYFTSKRNGLGLGLAATLNILQSHKATIDVQSKMNVGTSFILNFIAS